MIFTLEDIAGIGEIANFPGYADATPDLVQSVLDGAGKFAPAVLAPINRTSDQRGSRLENGVVRTPEGFRDAYGKFVTAGWNSLPFDPEHGGQRLPWALAAAMHE